MWDAGGCTPTVQSDKEVLGFCRPTAPFKPPWEVTPCGPPPWAPQGSACRASPHTDVHVARPPSFREQRGFYHRHPVGVGARQAWLTGRRKAQPSALPSGLLRGWYQAHSPARTESNPNQSLEQKKKIQYLGNSRRICKQLSNSCIRKEVERQEWLSSRLILHLQVPASHIGTFQIELRANAPGTAAEDGPRAWDPALMSDTWKEARGFWLQLWPAAMT